MTFARSLQLYSQFTPKAEGYCLRYQLHDKSISKSDRAAQLHIDSVRSEKNLWGLQMFFSTWEDALWSTYTLWFQDVKLDHQTSHPLTSASRKYWSCSLALMWRQPLLLAAIPLRPRWWSKHFQNICLAYYPIASMYGTCICLHFTIKINQMSGNIPWHGW